MRTQRGVGRVPAPPRIAVHHGRHSRLRRKKGSQRSARAAPGKVHPDTVPVQTAKVAPWSPAPSTRHARCRRGDDGIAVATPCSTTAAVATARHRAVAAAAARRAAVAAATADAPTGRPHPKTMDRRHAHGGAILPSWRLPPPPSPPPPTPRGEGVLPTKKKGAAPLISRTSAMCCRAALVAAVATSATTATGTAATDAAAGTAAAAAAEAAAAAPRRRRGATRPPQPPPGHATIMAAWG